MPCTQTEAAFTNDSSTHDFLLLEMACEMMNQFDDNDDDGIDIQGMGCLIFLLLTPIPLEIP